MTPKEKAVELLEKFSPILPFYSLTNNVNKSKQCALIAVDELFKETETVYPSLRKLYWRNVKLEIEKL